MAGFVALLHAQLSSTECAISPAVLTAASTPQETFLTQQQDVGVSQTKEIREPFLMVSPMWGSAPNHSASWLTGLSTCPGAAGRLARPLSLSLSSLYGNAKDQGKTLLRAVQKSQGGLRGRLKWNNMSYSTLNLESQHSYSSD